MHLSRILREWHPSYSIWNPSDVGGLVVLLGLRCNGCFDADVDGHECETNCDVEYKRGHSRRRDGD